jgi:hypothetical protein
MATDNELRDHMLDGCQDDAFWHDYDAARHTDSDYGGIVTTIVVVLVVAAMALVAYLNDGASRDCLKTHSQSVCAYSIDR